MSAVNMSYFVPDNMSRPLQWLGKTKWLQFDRSGDRWIISTNKKIVTNISPKERKDYPPDFWRRVEGLLFTPYSNDKEELLTYALSRAIAQGPKMFRPSMLQCKAFENTSVDIPFEQYAQPYEVLLIEFPEDYRKAKLEEGLERCPRYVISWYDRELQIIMAACQFDSQNDRIIGIKTYLGVQPGETIESLLSGPIYYEADGTAAEDIADFKIAQTFERIAINLNLLIMYGDRKHTVSPMNTEGWVRYRELKKKYERKKDKAELAKLREWGAGGISEIKFDESDLTQQIGFRVQLESSTAPDGIPGKEGKSPKPHWRRGHWAQQPYGPNRALRKPVLRPPVFVVGAAYRDGSEIDLAKTTVIITQKGDPFQPEAL
jgi:hypothetical protein